MGWGGEEKIEALEAGSLPSARASPGPGFSDFPNAREIQGSLCGLRLFAPDPDLVMPLIWFIKQWVGSLLGRGRGLLAVLKRADWIEFRPL